MNRRAKHKKKSKLTLTITLTLTAILMTAVVVWIGINDWDLEKSLEQIGVKQEEAPETVQEDLPQLEEEPSEEPGVTEEEPKGTEEAGEPEEVKPEEPEQPKEEPAEPAVPAKPEKKDTPKTESKPETKPNATKKPPVTDDNGYIAGQKLPDKPTYINGILIANKKYPLPSTYAPGESKDARAAFDEMAAEAKLSNINLTAFSTYRSYDYQVSLYDRYVKRDGKAAADRYSARPGYSEHQTGLAFDIGEENNQSHWASSSFGETEAGKWVADNAHRYGFILRYPKGKEAITGYMHEAWHFRYVGKDIATDIHNRKITLEEYLGIK
ncbi:M15 family metallopeptidase [Sporosarcina cyprini]|uniref:M15 family metallopeptidase n=1 Tax=Sporosarcina cyprini TaxID=2910523 RepID=UPI001EDE69B6|nr:M15 family metallopeptidase [Sporosarcina cyprini]MCG3086746.1 M15 family metallopeptidase [Sporosarcina cyprini]